MPLTRIEVEQLGADRWVAEVELAASAVRRVPLRARSFDGIVTQIISAYDKHHGLPGDVAIVRGAANAAASGDGANDVLRARAEALGVRVDGRWGAARLLQEIEGAITLSAATTRFEA